MERILITGGRAPVSLELVRQMSYAGKKVFVADSAPCYLTSSSRLIEKSFQLPRPRQSPLEFVDALERIIINEKNRHGHSNLRGSLLFESFCFAPSQTHRLILSEFGSTTPTPQQMDVYCNGSGHGR